MFSDKQKCSARVFSDSWGGHPCTRTASVIRNGKPYCKTHDPVARKEKEEKRTAEWNKKWDAKKKGWERQDLINSFFKDIDTDTIKERVANNQCPCCGGENA